MNRFKVINNQLFNGDMYHKFAVGTIVYKKNAIYNAYNPSSVYSLDPDGIYMTQAIIDNDVVAVDENGNEINDAPTEIVSHSDPESYTIEPVVEENVSEIVSEPVSVNLKPMPSGLAKGE